VTEFRFELAQLAADCFGQLIGADCPIARIHTDTRSVMPGDLFVAIRGERFDGNAFAAQALAAGAAAVLVERPDAVPPGASAIVVYDGREALAAIARAHRERCAPRVLAVTGSNGKTTVKEMLATILRRVHGDDAVLATEGNFNNDIGLPLTLLRLTSLHRFAVCEMGMNHAGEIAQLCRIAEPDVGIITNAGSAHLEHLGSLENIARAKGEIVNGLRENGIAILPHTDGFLPLWLNLLGQHPTITYGLDDHADLSGAVASDGMLTLHRETQSGTCHLAIPGRHNAHNACAAIAAAVAAGVPVSEAAAALDGFGGSKGRLQRRLSAVCGTVVDDTYNANPDSMRAAIAVLADAPAPRILVLGDMGELGPAAPALHREVGAAARAAGLESLLAVGELSRHTVAGFGAGGEHWTNHADLIAALRPRLTPTTTTLVKGSRFMHMETVVEALLAAGDISQPDDSAAASAPEATPCY
jgi:UDP-N-acetylmuramoyl-tripeptide--D-alanyl-D-alanine ligase